jgi:hypothetical protein
MIPNKIMGAAFAGDDAELDRLLDEMSVEELERLNSSLDVLLAQADIRDAVTPDNPVQAAEDWPC